MYILLLILYSLFAFLGKYNIAVAFIEILINAEDDR